MPVYDVYIKQGKKSIKVSKQPMPRNRGFGYGSRIVDNTVAGSFALKKAGMKRAYDNLQPAKKDKFRQRKTKNALNFVEKRKFRIDTKGEKQGLKVNKFLKRFKL